MKKFIIGFFVSLGVIFFLILLALGYLFVTDTFGIKSILIGSSKSDTIPGGDRNPLLSESQEKALSAIGIDPAKLPSAITPEMALCFESKLGKERTEEIKNGSAPGSADFLKAQSCF
jgi:hypothetical protein